VRFDTAAFTKPSRVMASTTSARSFSSGSPATRSSSRRAGSHSGDRTEVWSARRRLLLLERAGFEGVRRKRWVGLWGCGSPNDRRRRDSELAVIHSLLIAVGALQGRRTRGASDLSDVRLCLDYIVPARSAESSLLWMQSSSWW
jgi:hypothetical protein